MSDAPAPFGPDDIDRFRIALGRISRRISRAASDEGLTRSQSSLLGTVARHTTIGVRELADLEGLNPTMCSRMLGKLEDAGHVTRSPDDDDKRVVRAHITPAGAELAADLRLRRSALFAEHLAELTDTHITELHHALPALEALADSMGCSGTGERP